MPSDGNCQFSSISDQLLGTWKEHRAVRENVIKQLIQRQEIYAQFVPANYDMYCTRMSGKSWGDNVTVQAAADYYGVQINLITSSEDSILVQIHPREPKSSRVLWLAYVGGVHFNSLYTVDGCYHSLNSKSLTSLISPEWRQRKRAMHSDCCVS